MNITTKSKYYKDVALDIKQEDNYYLVYIKTVEEYKEKVEKLIAYGKELFD